MLDNQLIKIIRQAILQYEPIAGIAGIEVVQGYQPTLQGTPSQPTIFLWKLGDNRYGFTGRHDEYDVDRELMIHTELQKYETTFQLNALAIQSPNTPNQYTASDIVNYAASCLQSDATLQLFQAQKIGIERITAIRNFYFKDDFDKYEASPSFDFVITHSQKIENSVPVISETIINLSEV